MSWTGSENEREQRGGCAVGGREARYVIRQGTTVSTKKPGMEMREHVTEVELTFPVHEGFECAENRLGFLYRGWVLLVARKDVRQYGA